MDFSWLATDVKQIHSFFVTVYYSVVTLFLVIGIIGEYFKFPLGNTPSFHILISRAMISVVLLVSFPEILNALTSITDSICSQIGEYQNFKIMLSKVGVVYEKFTWSWSVEHMIIAVISIGSYLLLWITVFLMDALFYFAWTIPYVFSPLLIACYVLPELAHITKGLYKNLITVCLWKIVWGVMATLLWSTALLNVDEFVKNENFLTLIFFNIILAVSLLFTPKISALLFEGGSVSGAAAPGVALAMGAYWWTAKTVGKLTGKAVTGGATLAGRGAAAVGSKAWQHARGRSQQNPQSKSQSNQSDTKG